MEVYHQVAESYKHMAKLTYNALLCIGLIIVILVVGQPLSVESSRIVIMGLSIASTFIASYVSFTNPAEARK